MSSARVRSDPKPGGGTAATGGAREAATESGVATNDGAVTEPGSSAQRRASFAERAIGWLAWMVWTVGFTAARWIGGYPLLAGMTLVSGLAVIGLTAASAEVYEAVAESDGVAALDRPVLDFAMQARTPPLNAAVTGYTNLGGKVGLPILATLAAVALAIWRRTWTPMALIALASTGSVLMTVVGKAFVGRLRPPLAAAVPPYETSASFPSGHSLNTLVIVGVVAYLLTRVQRRWSTRMITIAAAGLFAVAMGFSRVYLGHHWLTDVLVAWTLGLAWLTVVIVVHQLYRTLRGRER